jgi:hypothetical protein
MDRLTNISSKSKTNYGLWILLGIITLVILHYIIIHYKDKKSITNIYNPLLNTHNKHNTHNTKNMNNQSVTNDANNSNIIKRFVYNDVINKNINTHDDNNSTAVYESNSYDDYVDRFIIDRTKLDTNPSYDYFDINEDDDDKKERNKFLDEYTKYTRFDKEPQKEFTNKDIDKHRNDYLDFHDKINVTTSGFDQVDRMNLVQLNENNFNKLNSNKTIAEIFDGLVNGRRPKYNNPEIKDYTNNALSFEYANDSKYKVNNFYNGLENYNYSNYGYNGFI